jgi:hypothetical protein
MAARRCRSISRLILAAALVPASITGCTGHSATDTTNATAHWIDWGVFLPDDNAESSNLWTVQQMAGSRPRYVMRFAALDDKTPIPELNVITAAGAQPILTLEPWQPDAGVEQPDYALSRIAAGDLDDRLDTWARNLAAWGQPLLLRFGHEMNSNHYPWSVGVNGNSAVDFVAAWNHVRSRFSQAGARNVSFMWCPDSPYEGSGEVAPAYPGVDAVDVLCLDGYNWGDGEGHTWKNPEDVFGHGLDQLRALDGQHPIIIGETASVEGPRSGQDKAEWIRRLFDFLARQSQVSAVVWFQMDKERDWRFNSSGQAQAAFKQAIADRRKS